MSNVANRIQVTNTPVLARALEVARVRWPEETRTSRLIERLATEGANHLDTETAAERKARMRAMVAANSTKFPDDYLETVRQGWR